MERKLLKSPMRKLLKSPMNYTGGKYKLLPQILPLFPKNINVFVDMFCGGFDVGINVNANKIVGNDICKEVIEVYLGIQREGVINGLRLVKNEIDKYGLSKTNEEGFKSIRNHYNNGNKDWYIFYAMLTHSFNYGIRFNKQGDYNMPFGRNRSSFNPKLEKQFVEFATVISKKNIIFTSKNFETFGIDSLTEKDFVYLDPPYLISCATYNEIGGWTEVEENKLLAMCDKLNSNGVKFALSNVLEHKGLENNILKEWAKKYNIHYLNYNYNNCNYHSTNKNYKTIEVLITNY